MYKDSHYKDKTVVRPSYLYNGNPYMLKQKKKKKKKEVFSL